MALSFVVGVYFGYKAMKLQCKASTEMVQQKCHAVTAANVAAQMERPAASRYNFGNY